MTTRVLLCRIKWTLSIRLSVGLCPFRVCTSRTESHMHFKFDTPAFDNECYWIVKGEGNKAQMDMPYNLELTVGRSVFKLCQNVALAKQHISRIWSRSRDYGIWTWWLIDSLHCALASCGAVYCNRSCLWVCDSGRAVSELYYSQRARSVCVSLSALFIQTAMLVRVLCLELTRTRRVDGWVGTAVAPDPPRTWTLKLAKYSTYLQPSFFSDKNNSASPVWYTPDRGGRIVFVRKKLRLQIRTVLR